MSKGSDVVAVYTTVETVGQARGLAARLVDERLAACANWWAIESRYHWQGRVEQGGEVAILLKTTEERLPALVAALKQQHPYTVPNTSSWSLDFIDSDYAAWVRSSVQGVNDV